ncbi:MAG: ABC transporter permease [Solidesulfovibrio sp. DCME]|uniref:ABC transporter permease n=1 Tax=Solidesulfovibrio sp. DCME TaxID=3447380 RepID=UPI003D13126D
MALFDDLALAVRLARRELRVGIRGFGVFLACLAIGVGAVAGVGSLAAAHRQGLARDAAALLGGDLEAALSQRPATPEELAALRALGPTSHLVSMQVMARGTSGPAKRALATLRAVDGAYPLYGTVGLTPAGPLADVLAVRDGLPGAAAAPELLARLGLGLGERIRVADGLFEIRAVLGREPDASAGLASSLGPRLLVGADQLEKTGLAGPGSLTRHYYRVKLPAGADAAALAAQLRQAFPTSGWRVRDATAAQPGLARFMDRLTAVTGLVALASLLLGGIGVSQAVSGYLDGRTVAIATLKCLGAPRRLVTATYLLVIAALAGLGIAAGLALGAAAPPLAGPLLSRYLPVAFSPGPYPGALALAAACGALTTLGFSLPHLTMAGRTPPLLLFRGYAAPGLPRAGFAARLPGLACLAALAALAVLVSPNRRLGIGFVVAVIGATALLRLLSRLAVLLAKLPGRRHGPVGLGLRALTRPDNRVGPVVAALGLGLSILCAMALVEANFRQAAREDIPRTAPAFFFVDIQPDQRDAFLATAAAVPGVTRLETSPMARGRIVRVKDVPAEAVTADEDVRWALQGDRGLTYATDMPEGTRLMAGAWWPRDYAGPPLVSVEEAVAKGLGLAVGDTVTVNVLGREITARVASLRRVNWLTLGINYVFVFSPGSLDGAPVTFLATAYTDPAVPGSDEAVFAAVTDRFPNVTAIGIGDALTEVLAIADKVATAVTVAAGATLAVGMLVLVQTMAAGLRRRLYEAIICKVCGAGRHQVLAMLLTENVLLGVLSGLAALGLGTALAMAFVTFFMELPFRFFAGPALGAVGLAAAATLVLGLAGVVRALSGRAWPWLRNE